LAISRIDPEGTAESGGTQHFDQGCSRQRCRSRPVVSVCIVNWNCKELLRRCLRSLTWERQKVALEIIIVDNGSVDGAAEMIASDFPRVRLIRNKGNVSFARANNQAVDVAHGQYLFFLNNDTVVPRWALRRLVRHARLHPEIGILGPRLRDQHGRTQTSCRQRPTVPSLLHRTLLFRWTGLFRLAYRSYRWRDQNEAQTRGVEVLMGAALLIRRKLLLEKGLWDEGYTFGGEDIELCTRIGRTHAVIYHPRVSIWHHGRASSRQRSGFVHTHWLLGMLRFLRQSGTPRGGLLLLKTAFTLDLPLQLIRHAVQGLWRTLWGQQAAARRSWRGLQGSAYFLCRGLPAFWWG
jgi:GT2 family glycosyltransferase